ncbi:hypothetical protein M422DRAFT_239364 [Sphaerobolus stellatus SS14]|nr:hypothetical protein M422DRAFT_239364 [Sphaerobolus stellatus SS14]
MAKVRLAINALCHTRLNPNPSPDNSRLHVLANTTEMLSRTSYGDLHHVGQTTRHRFSLRLNRTHHVAECRRGRCGLSPNSMSRYSFAPSNVPPTTNLSPEDLDLIRLWYALCSKETILNHVIVGAMDERTLQPNGTIAAMPAVTASSSTESGCKWCA